MPWFKIDDALHSHPKARKAGVGAMGLWSLSGSFSMAYKLDGFVPSWFVATWPQGSKHAAALVCAGLWDKATRQGEDGWQFHDWHDHQPLSDEIEKEREAARQRQRAWRAKRREARDQGGEDAA